MNLLERSRILNVFLVIAALIALGMAIHSDRTSRAYVRCQGAYNEANNLRTQALTEVTTSERAAERRRSDALDKVFLDPSLLKPVEQRTPAEQARVRALFVEYIDAAVALRAKRAEADKVRAENPLPPPPSQTCGV